MAGGGPKSAYELAMERLRQKDAEEGVDRRPLSDQQKAAIAEIRSLAESKLAELEILHHSTLRAVFDPAERASRDEEYRRDRERLIAERDAKIERVRDEPA